MQADASLTLARTDEPCGYVYVLCTMTPRGARTYVGWTLDPARRLDQHNAGTGAKSTRGQHWCLLYVERHESRAEAMSREWYLKRDRRFRSELARAHSAGETIRNPLA